MKKNLLSCYNNGIDVTGKHLVSSFSGRYMGEIVDIKISSENIFLELKGKGYIDLKGFGFYDVYDTIEEYRG